jgi:hypothetical protein
MTASSVPPIGSIAPAAPSETTGLLSRLSDMDRERLATAIQELLVHGSILGLEAGSAELYAWSRQNLDWLKETAALAGLDVRCEHESRFIQAVPKTSALLMRLKQDATLVLLALWYEYDTQVRDLGATDVLLSVEQLNRLLKEKLLPEIKSVPTETRMREILRMAERKNLVRLKLETAFESSMIRVLPSLKLVIPFRDLEEWVQTASMHTNIEAANESEEASI